MRNIKKKYIEHKEKLVEDWIDKNKEKDLEISNAWEIEREILEKRLELTHLAIKKLEAENK